jgi:hypothetical protein
LKARIIRIACVSLLKYATQQSQQFFNPFFFG